MHKNSLTDHTTDVLEAAHHVSFLVMVALGGGGSTPSSSSWGVWALVNYR